MPWAQCKKEAVAIAKRKTTPQMADAAAITSLATMLDVAPAPPSLPGGVASFDLGDRLRRLRRQKRWTLAETAERTGVTASALSKIENGGMSPTFELLQKIVAGMSLDFVALFDSGPTQLSFTRRSVTLRGEGKRLEAATYVHELLATDLISKRMLPFKTRILARSLAEFPTWTRHDGEEFLLVLSGTLEVHTELYAPVRLGTGDSIYFDSKMGHAVISVSREDAEAIWVCDGAEID